MADKIVNIDVKKRPTKEQIMMIEAASRKGDVADGNFPELTAEQLLKFRRISDVNNEKRRKQTITIRLSQPSINKAKSLGKGYTSILSRILEDALKDPLIIERHL